MDLDLWDCFGRENLSFPSQTIQKNLEPSCKIDLDLWIVLEFLANYIIHDLHICDNFGMINSCLLTE